MKTKFMPLLLIIAITFMPSTYAAEKYATNEIDDVGMKNLNVDGTKEAIFYKTGKAKIIDLKSKKLLFEGENSIGMAIVQDATNVLFLYKDGQAELRSLKNGKELFTEFNVESVGFYIPNEKPSRETEIALILYKNNGVAVRDLNDGELIYKDERTGNKKFTDGDFDLFYKRIHAKKIRCD